jgi:hypothetical protein
VAVIVQSPLLGFLGKAGYSQSKPEEGDTKLVVPGVISLGLEAPLPSPAHFSTSQAGVEPVYGWQLSISELFNTANTVELIRLTRGVWDIDGHLYVQPAGAVDDITATLAINFFPNDALGQTVMLARVANIKTVQQFVPFKFRITVLADNTYSFNRVKTAGAGTGLNLANYRISATKFF